LKMTFMTSMLHASPFTTQHGVSSGWRWRQPPDLEANYK